MLLPLLVARDWDKKNPDLEGKEQDEGETCPECGQEYGKDVGKEEQAKKGKGGF